MQYNSGNERQRPVFGLLHGSWHGSWCWDELEPRLLFGGYEAVPVELPNDIPGVTFDSCAQEAAYVINEAAPGREVILVAHSRAANIAPRMVERVAARHIIYLCGSFEPATLSSFDYQRHAAAMPAKYSQTMQSAFEPDRWGMSTLDHNSAVDLFFHDCTPEIQQAAAIQLGWQYKSSEEAPLNVWPVQKGTAQTYIMATGDRVISPAWSRYVAKEMLQIPLLELDSGHSPFYSQPDKLAAMLLSLAEDSLDGLVGPRMLNKKLK